MIKKWQHQDGRIRSFLSPLEILIQQNIWTSSLYKKTRNQLKAPAPQVSTKLTASRLVEKSWYFFVIVSWCSVMPLGIQKNKINPNITSYSKISSKWIRDLNTRAESVKLLEETCGSSENLHDISLGNDFLIMTPKA